MKPSENIRWSNLLKALTKADFLSEPQKLDCARIFGGYAEREEWSVHTLKNVMYFGGENQFTEEQKSRFESLYNSL